ncbi:MAG: NAD(P)-binding protein [Hamadaea sp.]|uniref:FAD-dependent monooxygenase n=1 Tax=Hamadaea sp. TaxID=2024425 RepID=UPI0017FB69AE|nr:FAD-dependent monooxygenase [Hamadaea sp.]NUR69241.1 NAD(P)-binding protein [Hamadaea sp.]NUT21103.1 NAD(P)-binding protein [Hamadaea sp.]
MRGSAAIIGGGIGGLTLASALHADGWDVTLFEREPGMSGAGTALGMWPSATRALDRIGVGAGVRSLGSTAETAQFRRSDGSLIASINMAKLTQRAGDTVYSLSRPALLELIHKATPPQVLRFQQPVDDVDRLTSGHDVVVAADGIFSRTRTQLFGEQYRARYTGMTAWRGWLDDHPIDGMTETWGSGGRKFGCGPQEGGRTNWYGASLAPERDFRPGRELVRLHEMFGGWHGPMREVLDAITEDGILRHDLYVTPTLPTYVRDNIALLGDAAHAMTPDLGRGACEAIIDAVALADCLRDARNVAEGLAAYDHARRRPSQRIATTAMRAQNLTRWKSALWLRDGLLKLSTLAPMPT